MSELLPWVASRTARHTSTCKGTDIRIRCRETIRERLQERDDLVLLRIAQAQCPTVMSILLGTSGVGQQFTFSIVPAGSFRK